DRVVGAAKLEGADALEVLRLEEDGRAGGLVERPGRDHRRAVGDAVEPPRGGPDVLDADHGVRSTAAHSPEWRRTRSVIPKAATTSSTSWCSSRERIKRSGRVRRLAATSSSSGRTRLAATVGAYGPGSRRRSQRVT